MPLTKEEADRLQQLEDMKRLAELEQRRAMTHSVSTPTQPEESETFKQGRKMPEWAQVMLKVGDVLGMGFPSRVMSPEGQQFVGGGIKQFEESHPVLSPLTTVAASIPGGLGPTNIPVRGAQEIGVLGRMGRATMAGTTQGAIGAAGQSRATTPGEYAIDILKGGGFGGLTGGGGSLVGAVAGPVVTNIAERVSPKVSLGEAQKRLVQALTRDAPEGVDFATYVRSQMNRLGPEGALLDTGENARQLADLLATLPGRGKKELREFVETRAQTRGERMAQAGQESLETGGKRLLSTLDDLAEQRSRDAGPLYRRLESFTVDDPSGTVAEIVRRAEELGATRIGEAIAKTHRITRGGKGWTYAGADTNRFNASDLANIKEGLDDLVEKEMDATTGKLSKLGQSYQELRDKLRSELVNRTTDPETGESVYGHALNAWAGPSAAREAAKFGSTILNRSLSADQLRKNLEKMSESELEAMRIGAFEAIRDKVGTSKAGRTEMMNLVENFVPREKLQVLFGSPEKFDKFYRTMVAERTMREADALGRGSQTLPRQAALGELNADIALDVGEMATGGPATWATKGAKAWNQVQLPESTRTQLARLLMQRGQQAEEETINMMDTIRRMNEQRARRAAIIGSVGAGATSQQRTRRSNP